MANLTAQAVWEEIYSIAEDDPVQGGDGGIDNIPHQQLANRTAFLKTQLDSAKGDIPAGEIVSLASLLQRIKNLEGKPAPTLPEMPTIKQFMIPVGGLFETIKPYANGGELATDMGYGTWQEYGRGRVTMGATTQVVGNINVNEQTQSQYLVKDGSGNTLLSQMGQEGGEYQHKLTLDEMPTHHHSQNDVFNKFSARATDVQNHENLIQNGTTTEASWRNGDPITTKAADDVNSNSELMVTGFSEAAWGIAAETTQGENMTHNNMQPYVVVGRWVRTA